MIELWKPIVGYEELYQVSSLGKIKRVGYQCRSERLLKPHLGLQGHLNIILSKDGKAQNHWIHRLVLQTFVGPCPKGMETRHLDGCPANNNLKNLVWGTRKQNIGDRRRHGVSGMGQNNSMAVLTDIQAEEIIDLLNMKLTGQIKIKQYEIAQRFGVSHKTISQIKVGDRWPHLHRPWREDFPEIVPIQARLI